MGYYYRIIGESDYADAVEVIRLSFATVVVDLGIDEKSFSSFSAFYSEQKLKTDIYNGTTFIGAYDSKDKALVGLVGYRMDSNRVGTIVKLAVLPSRRHLGIGRRLMFEAECRCKNLGCQWIELGYLEENTQLREWYATLGYKKGRSKAYKNTDLHIVIARLEIMHLASIVDRYGFESIRVMQSCELEEVDAPMLQILLVYSASEILRKTNTGVVSQQLLPKMVEEFIWTRGGDELLGHYISKRYSDDYEVVLVYKNGDTKEGEIPKGLEYSNKRVYVVLDGTWQEAKTMYNQSEYLKALPVIEIKSEQKSHFTKRRNQIEGGLCTAEIIGEIIKPYIPIEKYSIYATIIDDYI